MEAKTLDTQQALAAVGGRVIDCDSHYYEPDDCFTRHMDPQHRDLALVPRGPEGKRRWFLGDTPLVFQPAGMVSDWVRAPGLLAGYLVGKNDLAGASKKQGVDFTEVLAGGGDEGGGVFLAPNDFPAWRDRKARVELMDAQNVGTSLMFPTLGVVVEPELADRPDALCANYRAFNRWLEDDWGFANADQRIFSPALLTLADLDWAIEELESVKERGARIIWLTHAPVNGRSLADPMFDPFWSRVQEFGLKVVFHIGNEGFDRLYAQHWGEDVDRHIGRFSALQHYLAFGERPITDTIAALILHNFFGRFPGIELLSVENGSAWAGHLMKTMDKAAVMGRKGDWLGGPVTDLPSEIFRRHVYVNPFHEEDVDGLADVIGAERVVFGSDYPHAEGLREPLGNLGHIVESLGADTAKTVVFDNAAHLLGIS